MANIEELFGSSVFNDAVMQKRLPKDIYKALHKTITDGTPLDPQVANVVANAMKDWAVERGVTHYTHWFQPLTGITAEKHDSFISPAGGGAITSTPDRSTLYAVQTPQVFDRDLLAAALQNAKTQGLAVKDDCSAVEALGMPVQLTDGDEENLKITTPLDLELAALILRRRAET